MASIDTINAPVWGISTVGYGVIAQGIASIRQCIGIILQTTKKSDPLRPEFGSNISEYIDLPLGRAIPNIKLAIIEALGIWEPRIKVLEVRHYLKTISNPVFEIVYRLVDEDLIDSILFGIDGSGVESPSDSEIILQAFFPPNPHNYRYQIRLERNSLVALPAPSPNGFLSVNEMFAWVQENWAFYGRWYQLSDRIVLYMQSTGISSATLAVSVLPLIQVEAIFPVSEPGQSYIVAFSVSGVDAAPAMPGGLNSPGLVLSWVQQNWGGYASWFIEYSTVAGNSVFSEEFSSEFDTDGNFVQYKLIAVSNNPAFTATLSISNV